MLIHHPIDIAYAAGLVQEASGKECKGKVYQKLYRYTPLGSSMYWSVTRAAGGVFVLSQVREIYIFGVRFCRWVCNCVPIPPP